MSLPRLPISPLGQAAEVSPRLPRGSSGADLSAEEARRIALAAQGLAAARPRGAPSAAAIARTVGRLGLLQLDSVSVLVRAHYLPLFSRLGGYDREILDAMAAHDGPAGGARKRSLFEYWAHEASLLPLAFQPLVRWRMERASSGEGVWKSIAGWGRDHPEIAERVLREVAARGPLGVSDLEQAGRRSGPWWGWNDGKLALEWLFATGRLTAAGRRGFERLYDLPERVFPTTVLRAPTPAEADAHRTLLQHAATALGVATAGDLIDYFRLPVAAKGRIPELVELGAIRPVSIDRWKSPAYLAADADMPRRATATTLLSPFDPLVWERARAERLFGFRYRIEIYTPAAKRQHGYYVLPFLHRGRMAARVDLKAERASRTLRVQAAHLEPGGKALEVAEALRAELRQLATWLDLDHLAVMPRGDLAQALADASG
ncbi:MAG: crosslink repair DNA glycosylase YcaQ family protein [Geminicoccaceae bacterium]